MNELTIKKILKEATEKILEELQNTKTELKCAIDETEKKLLLKIEEHNTRIRRVEEEVEIIKEQIDRKKRLNNIVIFGLSKPIPNIKIEDICTEINENLNANINESDINNFYPLGKSESAPVKVEFVSYLKKKSIFTNIKNLKGSGLSISNDLTPKERETYKNLKSYLIHFRKTGEYSKCFIKNNKLVLDNKSHTLEELTKISRTETISPPNTPNLSEDQKTSEVNPQLSLIVNADTKKPKTRSASQTK